MGSILMALVARVKSILDAQYSPDGYNVGFNAGAAAGQTVPHVHIHVIPRYAGDMPDPRGGVRHVIPWKANYLARPGLEAEADPQAALVTGGDDPLLDHIAPLLRATARNGASVRVRGGAGGSVGGRAGGVVGAPGMVGGAGADAADKVLQADPAGGDAGAVRDGGGVGGRGTDALSAAVPESMAHA